MSDDVAERFVRWVLLVNGAVDLFLGAFLIIFPLFDLPIPGYYFLDEEAAFIAGGWGASALALGIGRLLASYYPRFYWAMAFVGLFEGALLTAFSMTSVFFLGMPLGKAAAAWAVGSLFGALYGISFLLRGAGGWEDENGRRTQGRTGRPERTRSKRY